MSPERMSIIEQIERNKRILLAEYQKGYLAGFKEAEKRSIEEFLRRLDWILDRIVFHTENSDSELIDEVSEEYIEWYKRLEQ